MRTVLSSGAAVTLFSAVLLLGVDHPLARLAALAWLTASAIVLGMALEHTTTHRKARP